MDAIVISVSRAVLAGDVRRSVAASVVDRLGGASETAVSYLADLLLAQAVGRATRLELAEPLALRLFSALCSSSTGRFSNLVELGDAALLVVGPFAAHARGRVSRDYVVGIGTSAYRSAASIMRAPRTIDVFSELASSVVEFGAVLGDASRAVFGHV